ncbi:hypothetical protein FPV67DRAFT_1436544 [Lyophyllum atratum]|nr:hypothetical protein FPV67DRAFT_1436544 [Lyophyllum atratum]
MSHCAMASLVAISHVNRVGRDRVREMFRSRLRSLILPFLPRRAAQEVFFQRLCSTNSAICGSIPFFLCNPLLPFWQFPPRDLNILTPNGGAVAWMRTLDEIGLVTGTMVVNVDRAFTSHVHSAVRYWTSNDTSFLIVESSSASVVPILLSSTLTSQINMLTSSKLYCFYPYLAASKISVGGAYTPSYKDITYVRKRGYAYTRSTTSWSMPCGSGCGAVWRRTRLLNGIATFAWGGYFGTMDISPNMIGGEEDGIEGKCYKWRIGLGICYNRLCPFSRNSPEHYRMVDDQLVP